MYQGELVSHWIGYTFYFSAWNKFYIIQTRKDKPDPPHQGAKIQATLYQYPLWHITGTRYAKCWLKVKEILEVTNLKQILVSNLGLDAF